MVTDFSPLTIWMYKDCYLRFCTQKFTLETTQQSVHLCNYSIQKYYKNDAERSDELPDENMWSSTEFVENYLTKINKRSAWEEIVYPGMKNAILSAMLSVQDIIEPRKNTFELYGADFMIGEDFKPWLIEINCSPTMARSTVVTTTLCDNVQEDLCKVVIDRKFNRNCDIGRFELLYRAPPVAQPNYLGVDLKIDGHACKKPPQAPQQNSYTTVNIPNNNNTNTTSIAQSKSFDNIELATAMRANRSGGPANATSSSTMNVRGPPPKRENTLATISIATSIQELSYAVNMNSNKSNTANILNNASGTNGQASVLNLNTILHKSIPNLTASTALLNTTTEINRLRREQNDKNAVIKTPKVFQFQHPSYQHNLNNFSRSLIERSQENNLILKQHANSLLNNTTNPHLAEYSSRGNQNTSTNLASTGSITKNRLVYKPFLSTTASCYQLNESNELSSNPSITKFSFPQINVSMLKTDHQKAANEIVKTKYVCMPQQKEQHVQNYEDSSIYSYNTNSYLNINDNSRTDLSLSATAINHFNKNLSLSKVQASADLSNDLTSGSGVLKEKNNSIKRASMATDSNATVLTNILSKSTSFLANSETLISCKDNKYYVDSSDYYDSAAVKMAKVSPKLLILNLSKKKLDFEKPIRTN